MPASKTLRFNITRGDFQVFHYLPNDFVRRSTQNIHKTNFQEIQIADAAINITTPNPVLELA